VPVRRFEPQRAGEAGARETLLAMYPALLTFFRRRLPAHRNDEARDLTHDTLLAAWAAVARSEPGVIHDLTHYVIGIARNKYQDALREAYRSGGPSVDATEVDGYTARLQEAAAERQLLEAEWKARWTRSLRKLRPGEREILRLRFVEEIGNAEACRRLGISPYEGSRLKYRALEKLRFLLRVKKSVKKWSPLGRNR